MSSFEEEVLGKQNSADNVFRDLDLESMKHVLSTRQGRRLIYSLLGVCHFGRSAFGGADNVTNLHAGKQLVGEHIIGLLNLTNPDAFSLMVKEAKEDEENERRNTSTQRSSADSNTEFDTSSNSEQPA